MKKRGIKIGFILVLLSIFGFTNCGNKKSNLPEKLGALRLSKVIRGNEATNVVNKMHGKMLEAKKYLIGYYGNGDSKNILYASVYENAEAAKADLMKMAMKMAGGTKVFSPLIYDKMGDKVRFKTEGMGLVHYFYRVDHLLLWWQVVPDKAESTYNELLNFPFTSLKAKETG